jgi:hypothetical protein
MPRSWKKNKYEWLSSVDIESVMDQYEEKYPEFKFLGPTPIDFDRKLGSGCVKNEICRLSIAEKIRKKIERTQKTFRRFVLSLLSFIFL